MSKDWQVTLRDGDNFHMQRKGSCEIAVFAPNEADEIGFKVFAAEKMYEELKEADETICKLCYIVNPHHATADYGVGCKSCKDRERRLKVLSEAEGRHR